MWTKLFYDKYAGDHYYSNIITRNVNIHDLEDVNNNYTHFQGKYALDVYNNKFQHETKLPDFLLDTNMYKLDVYTKLLENTSIYVIISINTALLEDLIKTSQDIPNFDFLIKLCRYHIGYTPNLLYSKDIMLNNILFDTYNMTFTFM